MGVLSSLMSKMTKCWERTSLAQPRASPVGSRGFGFGFAQRTHVLYILYVQAVLKRNPAEPMDFI